MKVKTSKLGAEVEAPEPEPVLVVETEPGYWTRGHYCEGTKSYIDPTKVWGLPVGTKLYTAPPAPSVPDGWRSAIAKEFPLYDEGEIDEDKHCCEWVMLQERKRLHKMLEATPPPPKLSDERILEIWASNSGRPVTMGKARIIAQARAIVREILGGDHD